jgi:hypothetical protein
MGERVQLGSRPSNPSPSERDRRRRRKRIAIEVTALAVAVAVLLLFNLSQATYSTTANYGGTLSFSPSSNDVSTGDFAGELFSFACCVSIPVTVMTGDNLNACSTLLSDNHGYWPEGYVLDSKRAMLTQLDLYNHGCYVVPVGPSSLPCCGPYSFEIGIPQQYAFGSYNITVTVTQSHHYL